MEATTNTSEIHSEHIEWLSNLSSRKNEIQSFNKRLGDILKSNNSFAIAANVEHFQNQFIRQNEVIDELRHDIKQYENELVKQVAASAVSIGERIPVDHPGLRDQMETFEKIYDELKLEFDTFINKTL